jgi:hypothetical protein
MILNKRLIITLAPPSWQSLPSSWRVQLLLPSSRRLKMSTRGTPVTLRSQVRLGSRNRIRRSIERRASLFEIVLRHLFKVSDAIVIRSTLSKWLQDTVTKTGHPHLVLAVISMLLAATIVFFLRGIFG